MKNIILSGALIGLILVITGMFAKVNHWNNASTLLNFGILGFVLLLVCGAILIVQFIMGTKR